MKRSAGKTSPCTVSIFRLSNRLMGKRRHPAGHRKDDGETRYAALGPIEGRLHCVCFTVRGNKLRIISLRKANEREVKIWLEK